MPVPLFLDIQCTPRRYLGLRPPRVFFTGNASMRDGTTPSEKYLVALARRTVLRLWCWPNPFHQRGSAEHGFAAKELCDLLVVFGQDIVIFSDKHVAFPNTGDLCLDWSRWYKRAIHAAAKQAVGARRWIASHPARVFTDRSCERVIPISLPTDDVRVHLVVVAHGAAERCSAHHGGSGSLIISTFAIGDAHYEPLAGVRPFVIGHVFEGGPFVHVLDDFSLDTVLKHLDTAPDFVQYLSARKALLTQQPVSAAGEEELLAHYLRHHDGRQHHFGLPPAPAHLSVLEGHWDNHISSAHFAAKKDADAPSYLWDKLIDAVSESVLSGRHFFPAPQSLNESEVVLRLLASENRVRRRSLASCLRVAIRRARREPWAVRLEVPDPVQTDSVVYVFLAIRRDETSDEQTNREKRVQLLRGYCLVAKHKFPAARFVVGIATEDEAWHGARSEDLMLLDGTKWTPEDEAEARALHEKNGLLAVTRRTAIQSREYPVADLQRRARRRRGRASCHCGSGKPYRRCCGH
jgi:hypothetical protein